jgi:hypothetical protein
VTSRRALWAAVVLSALLAMAVALPGVGVRATYGAHTTADEPHYLLTAITLAEDGDLDVSDELAAERWRAFHEAGLPIQERVMADGRQLAPHDPLLPAILAPAWALGGWPGAKVALALLAGVLAGLTTWTAVRRFAVRPMVAGAVVGLLSSAWPLAGYATQVYPELPAALATVALVAVGTAPGPPGRGRVAAVVALVTCLPWLAVKYAPVALAVVGVLAWQWWRDGHRRQLAGVVGLLAGSGAAYLALHQWWYTGWTVYAAADHFVDRGEFAVVGFDPNLPGRARRLVGLLVDRDFGLAAWQPLWLLAVPGLAVWLRRRPSGWAWVVVPLAAGWLNATFVALTMQGWWLPGRQVVVVLPLAGIALAWWLDRAGRGWRVTGSVLGALGIVSYGWLVVDGLRRRLTWVVDFASVGDPLYQLRRAVMPNYLDVSLATWMWQAVWLVLLAALAWQALRRDAGSPDAVSRQAR